MVSSDISSGMIGMAPCWLLLLYTGAYALLLYASPLAYARLGRLGDTQYERASRLTENR